MEDTESGLSKFLCIIHTPVVCITWAILFISSYFWWQQEGLNWLYTLLALFVFIFISNELYIQYPDFTLSQNMDCFNNGENGYRLAIVIKFLALVGAIIGVIIHIEYNSDWNVLIEPILKNETRLQPIDEDVFFKFWIWFFIASCLYTLNGIILLSILLQCGASDWKKENNKRIELFRASMHDLILGALWIFLSARFKDVIDDIDDTMWRSLFSSMVCFHLIVLLWKYWKDPTLNINLDRDDLKCCHPLTIPIWVASFKFLSYSMIYYVLLDRLHTYENLLVNMGIPDNLFLVTGIAIGFIILLNILENLTCYKNITNIEQKQSYKSVKDKICNENVNKTTPKGVKLRVGILNF